VTAGVGRLDIVVYDCAEPRALADFYAALLGREVLDAADSWVTLSADPPGAPKLAFQRVPGYQPPQWPSKDHPQQAHLDIEVTELQPAEQRALELGAQPASKIHSPGRHPWRVYTDPAGHPFCLVTGP
jgi:hypothetical protein